jgi:hypothetical protein
MIAVVSFLSVLFFFKEVSCPPSHSNYLLILLQTVAKPSPLSGDQTSDEIPLLLPSDTDETYSAQQLLAYRPVVISLVNHMSLNFLFTCEGALVPLFFAVPIEIGGLDFDPVIIGYILGGYRAFMILFVLTCSPRIIRRCGERFAFIIAIFSCMSIWTIMPIINLCARRFGISAPVWIGVVFITLPLSIMEMGTSASNARVTAINFRLTLSLL